MLSHVLLAGEKDPTISVGGILKAIGGNIRVIEQADSIWLDCLQASKSDSRRLGDLEASSLDQDEALAEIYQLLAGGEA